MGDCRFPSVFWHGLHIPHHFILWLLFLINNLFSYKQYFFSNNLVRRHWKPHNSIKFCACGDHRTQDSYEHDWHWNNPIRYYGRFSQGPMTCSPMRFIKQEDGRSQLHLVYNYILVQLDCLHKLETGLIKRNTSSLCSNRPLSMKIVFWWDPKSFIHPHNYRFPCCRGQIDAALDQGVVAVRTLVLKGFTDSIERFNLGQKYKYHKVWR